MTKLDVMLWDKDRKHSVRASKIRDIGIYPARSEFTPMKPEGFCKVLGWYNSNECFHFGYFDTEDEARQFIEELHRQIEGKWL